jgi:3-phosphoshikimate 1-carboxyvinyltransferase
MTQRAVAAALLAGGESAVMNPSLCDDALASADIAGALGARVDKRASGWYITPSAMASAAAPVLRCRESAFCARLFAPVAAVAHPAVTVTGIGTLPQRPMNELADALAAFGVRASCSSRGLPMQLSGLLTPGKASVTVCHSSQTLSGLLMALPLLAGDSALTVEGLASRSYIDMTLEVMEAFGVHISHENYGRFVIPGGQRYRPQTWTVEGDWSSVAYWIVTGAVGGRMVIDGLRRDSRQADRAILDVLDMVGVKYRWHGQTLTVGRGSSPLQAFHFNASGCPDLFPPLVLLATFCKGISRIEGVHRLRFKESDRAKALISTFRSLGVRISRRHDALVVGGIKRKDEGMQGGTISSFGDHRIAMVAACAGLFTPAPVRVDDMQCVGKSYPSFAADMARVVDMSRKWEQQLINRRKKQLEQKWRDRSRPAQEETEGEKWLSWYLQSKQERLGRQEEWKHQNKKRKEQRAQKRDKKKPSRNIS